MSFIEKNKVWLLPLLALGVLGVGYMNYRTFTGETPAASEPEDAAAQEATPQPETAVPSEGSTPVAAPEGTEAAQDSDNLWADLEMFAVVPGELAQEGPLRDRARVALDPALTQESPLLLERPIHSSLQLVRTKPGGGVNAEPAAPPQLDFLIHTPQGSYAWFEGRGYRVGESLSEGGYVVSRIGAMSVELTGPGGSVLEYTNPIHSVRKTIRDTVEAP